MIRARSFGREAILTIAGVLGALCIVWAVGTTAFGLKPLVFTSGSMTPAIASGDLALAKNVPAKDLAVGDIVSVETSAGTRVTHRITGIDRSGSQAALTLKGDANTTADDETYRVASAERVWIHIPKAGYVVHAASSPIALIVGGGLVVAAFFIAFSSERPGGRQGGPSGRSPHGGSRKAPRAWKGRKIAAGVSLAAALAGGLLVVPSAVPTLAYFKDTGTVASGTLAARTVTAPTSMTCTNNPSTGVATSATLTFPNIASNYLNSYVVEYAASATGAAIRTDVIDPSTSSPKSFTVNSGLLSGLLSGGSVWVRVYTSGTGTSPFPWKTTDYRSWQLNVSLVLGRVSCNSSVK